MVQELRIKDEINIVAVNMSFNSPQLFLNRNVSTTTKLNDGTFKAEELTSKMKFDGEIKCPLPCLGKK